MLWAARVVVSEDVLVRELGGEAVLLHLGSESYYGLDEVGTRFWHALAAEPDFASARERLLAEYEVAPAVLDRDLLDFIAALRRQRLVEVRTLPA